MATTKTKYRRTSRAQHLPVKGLAASVAAVEKMTSRSDLPVFNPGDTVKIHFKIKEGEKERIQIFEGVAIAFSNRGTGRSAVVRKISHGVGVERIFLLSSPKVAKIEVVQVGRVRRAKLYYLRNLEGKAARVERNNDGAAKEKESTDSKN